MSIITAPHGIRITSASLGSPGDIVARALTLTGERVANERTRLGLRADRADNTENLSGWDPANVFHFEEVPLPKIGDHPDAVVVKILTCALETNVVHAATGSPEPTRVAMRERDGEAKVIMGNAAVGQVVAIGEKVSRFKVGDLVMTHCHGASHPHDGSSKTIWAYDWPAIGSMTSHMMVHDWQILPLPDKIPSGMSLAEIAALTLRAWTAEYLFARMRASMLGKLNITREFGELLLDLPPMKILVASGGVMMNLAQRFRHNNPDNEVWVCAGSETRRKAMEAAGCKTINMHDFDRFATAEGKKAWRAFLRDQKLQFDFVSEMMGGPVFEAFQAAMAPGAVFATCGWRLGAIVTMNRPIGALGQHSYEHTHYCPIKLIEQQRNLLGPCYRATIETPVSFDNADAVMAALKRFQMYGNDDTIVFQMVPDSEIPETLRYVPAA